VGNPRRGNGMKQLFCKNIFEAVEGRLNCNPCHPGKISVCKFYYKILDDSSISLDFLFRAWSNFA